jgi:ribonuclease BN (tRNA processing enzyme)
MKLLVLGCGTIIQEGDAGNCSGYLLDRKLLCDCGPGIWRALHHYQIAITDIPYILLSHFHIDHTSDLAPILQERYLISEKHEEPLTIVGPAGLKSWFENLTALIGKWPREMNIQLIEINDRAIELGGFLLQSIKTIHTENSICYRIEKDNKSFFYSGDTDYNDEIQTMAGDCHLALMEASNSEGTKLEGHLTPGLAGKLAAQSRVKKLLLTHMYPEVIQAEPVAEAARYFKGEIIIAKEGMELIF